MNTSTKTPATPDAKLRALVHRYRSAERVAVTRQLGNQTEMAHATMERIVLSAEKDGLLDALLAEVL